MSIKTNKFKMYRERKKKGAKVSQILAASVSMATCFLTLSSVCPGLGRKWRGCYLPRKPEMDGGCHQAKGSGGWGHTPRALRESHSHSMAVRAPRPSPPPYHWDTAALRGNPLSVERGRELMSPPEFKPRSLRLHPLWLGLHQAAQLGGILARQEAKAQEPV